MSEPRDLRRAFVVEEPLVLPPTGPRVQRTPLVRAAEALEVPIEESLAATEPTPAVAAPRARRRSDLGLGFGRAAVACRAAQLDRRRMQRTHAHACRFGVFGKSLTLGAFRTNLCPVTSEEAL